jgi:alcohol dehydrogenase class IV
VPPKANFSFPTRYRLGCGRRSELAREAKVAGIGRALLVTDAGVAALPWFEDMCAAARDGGLDFSVFDGVKSNPVEANVVDGLAAYRAGDCDGVVLVGGGSAMDTGKAIALLAGNDGSVFDYEFGAGAKFRAIDAGAIAPMIAIPTTAGSGSELSTGAVITDVEAGVKRTLLHARFLPASVIADPETTYGLPAHLTAATGMDAFTHCFEAYCAPGYHPMADGIALEGMRLLGEHLPVACADPENAAARTHVMTAASMGAVAFQKGLGLVHAMVHPLGALTDIHHGLGNAIVLPYVMAHNREAIAERMKLLAGHLAAGDGYNGVLAYVLALREAIGIPHALKGSAGIEDIGLADELAKGCMGERIYLATNPATIDEKAARGIYVAAIEGRLA